jgi:hypothetical protein
MIASIFFIADSPEAPPGRRKATPLMHEGVDAE